MPSSNTAARCCRSTCQSINGTPMSLFRLPRVASRVFSPNCRARIEAIICVTVVLPLLPVTAITGRTKRERQCAAPAPSARWLSATMTCGSSIASGRSTSASAPCRVRVRRSHDRRSVRRAAPRTSAPDDSVRESVDTLENCARASPCTSAAPTASESVRRCSCGMPVAPARRTGRAARVSDVRERHAFRRR